MVTHIKCTRIIDFDDVCSLTILTQWATLLITVIIDQLQRVEAYYQQQADQQQLTEAVVP